MSRDPGFILECTPESLQTWIQNNQVPAAPCDLSAHGGHHDWVSLIPQKFGDRNPKQENFGLLAAF
jgi:hypothetical protein